MKVGDLVRRKKVDAFSRHPLRELGMGLVLSKQMFGSPKHPCITVWYSKSGKKYDIAESLMEVISDAS